MKPASPESCVFPETSTMAPFTALLTLELQAPSGIHKLRRATKQIAVYLLPPAVKTANVWDLCPGETCQPECCVFPETSTMAPLTALLTMELHAPLGIQNH